MAAFVPSVLPSSTRTSSPGKPPTSKTPSTRRASSSTLNSSLKHGTTTDSSMDIEREKLSEIREKRDQEDDGEAGQRGNRLVEAGAAGRARRERHGQVDREKLLVNAEGRVQHAETLGHVVGEAGPCERVIAPGRDCR